MKDWLATVVSELNDLIVKIRGKLTSLERKVIVALVTTDVHARDIGKRLRLYVCMSMCSISLYS
jgi:dynein heavy chain